MTLFYYTILIIGAIAMLVFDQNAKNSKHSLYKIAHPLIIITIIVIATSMAASMIRNEFFALLSYGIHSSSSTWMLMILLLFLQKFTGFDEEFERIPKKIYKLLGISGIVFFYVLAIVDSISLIANAYFKQMTTLEEFYIGDKFYANIFVGTSIHYYMHLALVYVVTMGCIFMLVKKIFKTGGFYRTQYLWTLTFILIAILIDVFNHVMSIPLDMSLFAYELLAIFLCYYPIVHIPRSLTSNMIRISSERMDTGLICFDVEESLIYANEHIRNLFPKATTNDELKEAFLSWINHSGLKKRPDGRFEKVVNTGEDVRYYEVTYTKHLNSIGGFMGAFYTVYDETEERKKVAKELYLASHDAMTGLYNREKFFMATEELIKENQDKTYYIIYSNVKDFKLINDIFGIEAGDKLLVAFARMLQDNVKEGAVFGRLESDHFAMCLPKERFNEKIYLDYIENIGSVLETDSFKVHIYLGVYEVRDIHEPIFVMCDRANIAINTIKGDYQYSIAYYDEKFMQQALYEKSMIDEFDQAIKEKQFKIYLQPQMNGEGKLLGAEALVRWEHPKQGLISPGNFLPVFEKAGLIYLLDLYVWEQACKKLSDWKKRGLEEYYISVNISPRDFYYLDLFETFTMLVSLYHINPSCLKLEITESALMSDFDKQVDLINRLREYGFHVEMDDFGSGYSSLNMLKDIIFDMIKIDMEFLQETGQKERSKVILGKIISMSEDLMMPVLVEGVETEAQLRFLTDLGCDIFQGYYFEKPMQLDAFENKYLNVKTQGGEGR